MQIKVTPASLQKNVKRTGGFTFQNHALWILVVFSGCSSKQKPLLFFEVLQKYNYQIIKSFLLLSKYKSIYSHAQYKPIYFNGIHAKLQKIEWEN